jgi:hypothetical protein
MLACVSGEATAGAWTYKRGHGFYKLEARYIHARQYFEPDGNVIDIPELQDFTASFYGEYGLTDRLNLTVYAPFYQRLALNRQISSSGLVLFPGDTASGFADMDVSLRFGLRQDRPTVLSARLLLGLPTGNSEQAYGLVTGDGEFNQMLMLEVGHSFYPRPVYVIGEFGVNNRTNDFSDEFRYGAELGFTFWRNFTATMRVTGVQSLRNGTSAALGGYGGLYGNDVSYLALAPSLTYKLAGSLGVTGGVDAAAFGENVLASPTYSLGVFWAQ